MSFSFDSVPYEVLDRIIQNYKSFVPYAVICDTERNLRQFRLVNKRWQSIADKYIYRRLIVTSKLMGRFYQLLISPQQEHLVKSVFVKNPFGYIEKGFFQMFSSINEIHCNEKTDWKQLNKALASSQCIITSLAHALRPDFDTDSYVDFVANHCGTLEKWNTDDSPEASAKVLATLNEKCFFPKLKELTADFYENAMRLDDTINKCPVLERLDIVIWGDLEIPSPLPNIQQHQQVMKSITAEFGDNNPVDTFNYFTAKFPKVKSWKLLPNDVSNVIDGLDRLEPFERLKTPLELIMQSDEAHLGFFTYCSLLTELLKFFCEFDESTLDVRVQYQDAPMHFSREAFNTNGSLDAIGIKVCYTRSKPLSSIHACIAFLTFDSSQFNFIERIGHRFRSLDMKMPSYIYTSLHDTEENQMMIRGGALAHALSHCPALKAIKYETKHLALDSIRSAPVHTNIKKVALHCKTIEPEVFSELQTKVPNLTDLVVEANLNYDSAYEQREITVNMPQTSFDYLTVKEELITMTDGPPGMGEAVRNIFRTDFILGEIHFSTQQDPRYYKLDLASDDGLVECGIEEYQNISFRQYCAKFIIRCRLIKCLKLLPGKKPSASGKLHEEFCINV